MSDSVSNNDKIDYLEVDECIPGQNFVCLSFLSPEKLIENKEAFKCTKFLQSLKTTNLKDVYSKYEDLYINTTNSRYDLSQKFQTSIRGLKVRCTIQRSQEAAIS